MSKDHVIFRHFCGLGANVDSSRVARQRKVSG